MALSAKELMIGDWVVQALTNGSSFGVAKQMQPHMFTQTNFEPIPLTPEILEKNGFKLRYDPKGLYSYKGIFRLWYDEDVKEIYLNIGLESIVMDSVHKLQHALRLCGLPDLADNFKI